MAAPRRIGILTGGGDVPGLNSVIKSVVYRATDLGYEVVGIRRGWEGLTHQRRGTDLDPEYVRVLDRTNTRTIDRTGGTILHSSRTNPRKMRATALPSWLDPKSIADKQTSEGVYDLTDHVLDTIDHLGLTNLVTIGGDDTLSFSSVLYERGLPLVAIPKTMDNDVNGTEYCIGFSSAITRAKEVLNRQRTTLYTAYVTSTRCVLPEFPYDIKALAEILKEDHRNNPSRYAIVITAEGAIWEGAQIQDVGDTDAFGHRHKMNVGEVLASELKTLTGIEAVASDLTYDLRSGEPDMLDSMVATTFANVAMDLIRDGIGGRMVAIREGKYSHVSLAETAKPPRRVQLAAYDTGRFRPKYADREGDPLLLTPSLGPAES
jgi:6-phosphofructokinase